MPIPPNALKSYASARAAQKGQARKAPVPGASPPPAKGSQPQQEKPENESSHESNGDGSLVETLKEHMEAIEMVADSYAGDLSEEVEMSDVEREELSALREELPEPVKAMLGELEDFGFVEIEGLIDQATGGDDSDVDHDRVAGLLYHLAHS